MWIGGRPGGKTSAIADADTATSGRAARRYTPLHMCRRQSRTRTALASRTGGKRWDPAQPADQVPPPLSVAWSVAVRSPHPRRRRTQRHPAAVDRNRHSRTRQRHRTSRAERSRTPSPTERSIPRAPARGHRRRTDDPSRRAIAVHPSQRRPHRHCARSINRRTSDIGSLVAPKLRLVTAVPTALQRPVRVWPHEAETCRSASSVRASTASFGAVGRCSVLLLDVGRSTVTRPGVTVHAPPARRYRRRVTVGRRRDPTAAMGCGERPPAYLTSHRRAGDRRAEPTGAPSRGQRIRHRRADHRSSLTRSRSRHPH